MLFLHLPKTINFQAVIQIQALPGKARSGILVLIDVNFVITVRYAGRP